jgi:hypothetical protein
MTTQKIAAYSDTADAEDMSNDRFSNLSGIEDGQAFYRKGQIS